MAHFNSYAWFFLALLRNLSLPLALALSPDGTILLQVKQSLVDNSNALDNWNRSDENPCAWTGISCDASRSVTQINFTGFTLAGNLNSAICELPNLISLEVQRNNFEGPFPAGLFNCTKLQTLDLSFNAFTRDIPYEILGLGALKTLRLDHNLFDKEIPGKIYLLEQLNQLNLRSNRISGKIEGTLGSLTALVALDLSQNELEGEIPVQLGDLQQLTEFNVSYNKLSGPVPDGLNKLAFRDSFIGNPGLCGGGALNLPPCNLTK